MTLTDPVEVTWQELQVDGAPLRAFGETLRRDGVVMLRDCPLQRKTPPAVLYEVVEQLFRLPLERLLSFEVADPKNEGGYVRSGPWHGSLLPEGWHIVSETRPPVRPGRPASVWPSELPHLRSVLLPYHAQLTAAADTILSAVARLYARPADYLQRLRTGAGERHALARLPAPPARSLRRSLATPSQLDNSVPGVATAAPGLSAMSSRHLERSTSGDGSLIGTGGALGVLTDGDLRPLQHRVRQLSTSGVAKRYSVSMFVNPRPDIKVTLLRESSGGVGDEADQRAQTFEAWFQERVRQAQRTARADTCALGTVGALARQSTWPQAGPAG